MYWIAAVIVIIFCGLYAYGLIGMSGFTAETNAKIAGKTAIIFVFFLLLLIVWLLLKPVTGN